MFRLVYVSVATIDFTQAALSNLLAKARRRNEHKGITGMLLFRDGDFMQLLEGEETDVREIYSIICLDSRHRNIVTLLEEPADQRLFADWTMGFHRINDSDVGHIPGYTRFLDDPLRSQRFSRSPHECLQLLGLFDSMF